MWAKEWFEDFFRNIKIWLIKLNKKINKIFLTWLSCLFVSVIASVITALLALLAKVTSIWSQEMLRSGTFSKLKDWNILKKLDNCLKVNLPWRNPISTHRSASDGRRDRQPSSCGGYWGRIDCQAGRLSLGKDKTLTCWEVKDQRYEIWNTNTNKQKKVRKGSVLYQSVK